MCRRFSRSAFVAAALTLPSTVFAQDGRSILFPADYVDANRGTEQFLIPEGYELANIIISLTPYGKDRRRIFQDTDYYGAVQQHFGSFSDHPLIAALNLNSDEDVMRYIYFRENGAYWSFEGDSLVRRGPYQDHWHDEKNNVFAANVALVQDFAQKSGFRNFYAANRAYYDELTRDFQAVAPLSSMVRWLEDNFGPGYRYDSYKVIFSPLVSVTHSAHSGTSPQYRESLLFVAAPHIFKGPAAQGEVARMIFTEVDHHFVNPVSDLHKNEIDAAMSNVSFWNDMEVSYGYRSPYATFNEYMTWSVFSLWAKEHYDPDLYDTLLRLNRYDMWARGFRQFPHFDEALISRYTRRRPGTKIPDLYPGIIDFAKKHQAQTLGYGGN